jgi:hypothetical protein
MSTEEPITFDVVSGPWVQRVAGYTSARYRHYQVDPEDVTQEIYAWLYGKGSAKVERWLANDPQQTTRVYRSLLDVALGYAENEKAMKVGYKPDDVWWYTASSVEGLMPLVLDPTFTEKDGHVGELLTSVVDIRRVMYADDIDYFTNSDDTAVDWADRIQDLVNRLGGNRPYVGRRKALSNATAIAITTGALE